MLQSTWTKHHAAVFIQESRTGLVEKYIRVARLHRSMMERRLDGTGCTAASIGYWCLCRITPTYPRKNWRGVWRPGYHRCFLKKLERGAISGAWWTEDNRCNQICITDKEESGGQRKDFLGKWRAACLKDFPRMIWRCWDNCWTGYTEPGPSLRTGHKGVNHRWNTESI